MCFTSIFYRYICECEMGNSSESDLVMLTENKMIVCDPMCFFPLKCPLQTSLLANDWNNCIFKIDLSVTVEDEPNRNFAMQPDKIYISCARMQMWLCSWRFIWKFVCLFNAIQYLIFNGIISIIHKENQNSIRLFSYKHHH